MQEALKLVGTVAAVWVAVSIPVALILGQVLKRRNKQYPAAALHVVKGDQR